MSMMLIDQTKDSACKTAEADAIRAKTGGSAQIAYDWENNKGFADAVDAIQTGGDPQEDLVKLNNNQLTSFSNSDITKIREYLFDSNTALTSVYIPNVRSIGQGAFLNSGLAGDITFERLIMLALAGFRGTKITSFTCKSFETVQLDQQVLEGCSLLEAIDLTRKNGSFTIRYNSVYTTPNLTTLILRTSVLVTLNGAFPSSCALSSSGNIYVPSDLVDSYKAASNWSVYADRILPIEGSYYETHWANGEAIS